MKQLNAETNLTVAQRLLEVVPLIMRGIRTEMRLNRGAGLSVPQFRSLAFIDRHDGASLSAIADHLGLTMPSASKLIDGLVAKGLLTRCDDARDRRRLILRLTAQGASLLATTKEAALTHLADSLSTLPPAEMATISTALRILRGIFGESEDIPEE